MLGSNSSSSRRSVSSTVTTVRTNSASAVSKAPSSTVSKSVQTTSTPATTVRTNSYTPTALSSTSRPVQQPNISFTGIVTNTTDVSHNFNTNVYSPSSQITPSTRINPNTNINVENFNSYSYSNNSARSILGSSVRSNSSNFYNLQSNTNYSTQNRVPYRVSSNTNNSSYNSNIGMYNNGTQGTNVNYSSTRSNIGSVSTYSNTIYNTRGSNIVSSNSYNSGIYNNQGAALNSQQPYNNVSTYNTGVYSAQGTGVTASNSYYNVNTHSNGTYNVRGSNAMSSNPYNNASTSNQYSSVNTYSNGTYTTLGSNMSSSNLYNNVNTYSNNASNLGYNDDSQDDSSSTVRSNFGSGAFTYSNNVSIDPSKDINNTEVIPDEGTIRPDQIDYSRITTNEYRAAEGDFIREENIWTDQWGDNESGILTYEKMDNGTYLIREDGVGMGFTDAEGLAGLTGNPVQDTPQVTSDTIPTNGTISADQIDYSRITSNEYRADAGDFIPENRINEQEFGQGQNVELTYEQMDNGTYLIRKNGVAMGFTDKEGLGINNSSQSSTIPTGSVHSNNSGFISGATYSNTASYTQNIAPTATETKTQFNTSYSNTPIYSNNASVFINPAVSASQEKIQTPTPCPTPAPTQTQVQPQVNTTQNYKPEAPLGYNSGSQGRFSDNWLINSANEKTQAQVNPNVINVYGTDNTAYSYTPVYRPQLQNYNYQNIPSDYDGPIFTLPYDEYQKTISQSQNMPLSAGLDGFNQLGQKYTVVYGNNKQPWLAGDRGILGPIVGERNIAAEVKAESMGIDINN